MLLLCQQALFKYKHAFTQLKSVLYQLTKDGMATKNQVKDWK